MGSEWADGIVEVDRSEVVVGILETLKHAVRRQKKSVVDVLGTADKYYPIDIAAAGLLNQAIETGTERDRDSGCLDVKDLQ